MKRFKYVAISLIAHLSALALLIALEPGKQESEKQGEGNSSQKERVEILPQNPPETVEISFIETEGRTEEILDRTDSPPQEEQDDDNSGYWGIGIQVNLLDLIFDNSPRKSMTVVRVIEGNPAHRAGILVGDKILKVDGIPVSFDDRIVGEGPKLLVLTVERRGRIMTIRVNREWIRTKARD